MMTNASHCHHLVPSSPENLSRLTMLTEKAIFRKAMRVGSVVTSQLASTLRCQFKQLKTLIYNVTSQYYRFYKVQYIYVCKIVQTSRKNIEIMVINILTLTILILPVVSFGQSARVSEIQKSVDDYWGLVKHIMDERVLLYSSKDEVLINALKREPISNFSKSLVDDLDTSSALSFELAKEYLMNYFDYKYNYSEWESKIEVGVWSTVTSYRKGYSNLNSSSSSSFQCDSDSCMTLRIWTYSSSGEGEHDNFNISLNFENNTARPDYEISIFLDKNGPKNIIVIDRGELEKTRNDKWIPNTPTIYMNMSRLNKKVKISRKSKELITLKREREELYEIKSHFFDHIYFIERQMSEFQSEKDSGTISKDAYILFLEIVTLSFSRELFWLFDSFELK